MKKIKIDYLSTLFVGIDIGSRTNVISALNFDQDFLIKMVPVANAQGGAEQMEEMVAEVLSQHHEFKTVILGLESTGFYGVHIANYLSASEKLAPFSTKVYCLNPNELNSTRSPLTPLTKMTALILSSSLILQGSGASIPNPGGAHSTLPSSGLPGTGSISRNASPGRRPTC